MWQLSQNDVREVLQTGNFDESYLDRACEAIVVAQEIEDARPEKKGGIRSCGRVCSLGGSPSQPRSSGQPAPGFLGGLFKKSKGKDAAAA